MVQQFTLPSSSWWCVFVACCCSSALLAQAQQYSGTVFARGTNVTIDASATPSVTLDGCTASGAFQIIVQNLGASPSPLVSVTVTNLNLQGETSGVNVSFVGADPVRVDLRILSSQLQRGVTITGRLAASSSVIFGGNTMASLRAVSLAFELASTFAIENNTITRTQLFPHHRILISTVSIAAGSLLSVRGNTITSPWSNFGNEGCVAPTLKWYSGFAAIELSSVTAFGSVVAVAANSVIPIVGSTGISTPGCGPYRSAYAGATGIDISADCVFTACSVTVTDNAVSMGSVGLKALSLLSSFEAKSTLSVGLGAVDGGLPVTVAPSIASNIQAIQLGDFSKCGNLVLGPFPVNTSVRHVNGNAAVVFNGTYGAVTLNFPQTDNDATEIIILPGAYLASLTVPSFATLQSIKIGGSIGGTLTLQSLPLLRTIIFEQKSTASIVQVTNLTLQRFSMINARLSTLSIWSSRLLDDGVIEVDRCRLDQITMSSVVMNPSTLCRVEFNILSTTDLFQGERIVIGVTSALGATVLVR